MFTKEQLARWREQGFQFDDFYDQVAVDKKEKDEEDGGGSVTDVRILSRPPYKFGDSIEVEIMTKGLSRKNTILTIELLDDDSVLGIGEDVQLYKATHTLNSDILRIKIPLTDKMQNRAFGSWEGDSADCFVKVSYKDGKYAGVVESKRIEIKYNEALAYEAYMEQRITNPSGKGDVTHRDAVLVLNDKNQTIAFITPDEKLFLWVKEPRWEGYFEDGKKAYKSSYIAYIEDAINRQVEPVSWGIYLAATDSGQFVIDLIDNPKETVTGLGKALKKIITLDFDIEAVWQRIQEASPTDVSYVVSCILMSRMASVPSKGVVKGVRRSFAAVPKKDLHKLSEIIEYYAQVQGIRPITWPELLALFDKALKFERMVTQELLKKYPVSQGYIHIERLYLRVNNVTSIADNCIYNTNTGKWILNETKFGISNKLRTNQYKIDRAIRGGAVLEIRSSNTVIPEALRNLNPPILQGSQIQISEILRSHGMELKILPETIKTEWP